MEERSSFDLEGECFMKRVGEGDSPVFIAFTGADDDLAVFEFDVFDPEVKAFIESESGAIE